MQTSNATAEVTLRLPENIQAALKAYAHDNEFSLNDVLEMAVASFLDVDAIDFDDCKPVMTPGQLREENIILKQQLASGKKVDLTNFTVQTLT
jgi:hypothetical protein